MPFLGDRSKPSGLSRTASDPFIDAMSVSGSDKAPHHHQQQASSPPSSRILQNAVPVAKQAKVSPPGDYVSLPGGGRGSPTAQRRGALAPSTSKSMHGKSSSSSISSTSPRKIRPFHGSGIHRPAQLPSLNLASIKKYAAWPGAPINPPTPLAHPPTPLARPPVGSPALAASVSSSSQSANGSPFGINPDGSPTPKDKVVVPSPVPGQAALAASVSSGAMVGRPLPVPAISALRISRPAVSQSGHGHGLSPFALAKPQADRYIAYNLDDSPRTPGATVAPGTGSAAGAGVGTGAVPPLSPPPTPYSSEKPPLLPLSTDSCSPPKIASSNFATPPPSSKSGLLQSVACAAAKSFESSPPPPASASSKWIREKGLLPAFEAQYDLLEELGSGGFGFVVKARRKADGLVVAVKFIYKERIPSHGFVRTKTWDAYMGGMTGQHEERLVPLEAYVLRMVRHRGVVAFLDLLEDRCVFYLVMEHHGNPWQSAEEGEGHDDEASHSPASTEGGLPELSISKSPSSSSIVSSSSTSTLGPPTPLSPNMPLHPMVEKLSAPKPPPFLRRSSCDLFECIEQYQRLPEEHARFVFGQIVDVVYHLATLGICHRDIKDENIVVDRNFKVKLIDFGSAVIHDPRKPALYHSRFFGTINFAAAEILEGKPYRAPHAEVWSLGVLLSVVLTGETPFADAEHAIRGHLSKPKCRISPAAMDLMLGCLQVDPERRFTIAQVKSHPWLNQPRSA